MFEAKTKDSKKQKIRGQGQGPTFPKHTHYRPRTGMLEAKAQGHKCKSSPKKKVLRKNFQAISKKKKKEKKVLRKKF